MQVTSDVSFFMSFVVLCMNWENDTIVFSPF